MAAVSADAVEWALSSYEDQHFDSVSMGQSTVVDSDYAANQVWAHAIQQELASYGHGLPPTGTVNVQIQLVNSLSTSDIQQKQEVVTTKPKKKKIRIGRKVKMFYGILTILILTAVVAAVFSMINGNWEDKMTTPTTAEETTVGFDMLTALVVETTTPLAAETTKRSAAETTTPVAVTTTTGIMEIFFEAFSCTSYDTVSTCFAKEHRRDELCESTACEVKRKSEYDKTVFGTWKCFCCQCHPYFESKI